ncbi:hypothetical protein [Mesorhizobium sp. M0185]|uniref:hypothetical protein n=1 Tax=Mesorhizobium sp. M0185 TaxID=2956907 RepID=UPI00333635F5
MRDILAAHVADLGGVDAISQAELSICRRAATLTIELERMENEFAVAGGASERALDAYQRASNTLRRTLEAIGLKRRSKDITPHLHDYIGLQP